MYEIYWDSNFDDTNTIIICIYEDVKWKIKISYVIVSKISYVLV